MIDVVKFKHAKLIIIVLFVICLYVVIFEPQRSTGIDLVAVTNNQLISLKNFKHDLEKANEKLLLVEDKYLFPLGFKNNSNIYPDGFSYNITLPVIVTYVMSGQQDQAISFAKNVAKILPSYITFLYNIGLKEYELFLLQNFCKSNHCTVINFEWDIFPSYIIEDVNLFRPLIIQDALNKVGVVFYVDSNLRFMSSNFDLLVKKAEKSGIIVWRGKYPTSTVTHPRMYDYFKTTPNKYYFLPSVDVTRLVIFNVPHIHLNVMFPWIKCILIQNCINPIGSQDSGCVFNKKPIYRYSGCHKAGVAPLSVVLGLQFKFNYKAYTYDDSGTESLFHNITADAAKLELSLLVKNSSDFQYIKNKQKDDFN